MYTIIVNTPGPQGSQGPQGPSGSQGQSADTGSLVTTSSFNSFTSSYYVDSASFNSRINNITFDTSSLATTGSNTFIGNQTITGSVGITGSLTVNTVNVGANTINFVDENKNILTSLSYSGSNLILSTGSFVLSTGSLAGTASYAQTASFVQNAQTASYVQNAVSSSFSLTSSYVNTLNQDVLITGSLTVLQGATIYGSSSFLYVTASQLAVSASYISVNIFEPSQRFGGLIVYDSGSSQATASLTWDSLNNHWVYQNASGSNYNGGGLISGPRNTGSLGQETYPTLNKVVRGQGGDHIYDSNITDNDTKVSIGISTDITGSLIVTSGITGSFSGSGANLFNIPSSAITGLNLSQISSGSYSASISNNQLLVNTDVVATSFIGNGSQLTGIFLEKRHDFTGSYSYCGTAPSGSAESANVWDINRITIYPAGNTLIQSASLVSWTGRYSHIYN